MEQKTKFLSEMLKSNTNIYINNMHQANKQLNYFGKELHADSFLSTKSA